MLESSRASALRAPSWRPTFFHLLVLLVLTRRPPHEWCLGSAVVSACLPCFCACYVPWGGQQPLPSGGLPRAHRTPHTALQSDMHTVLPAKHAGPAPCRLLQCQDQTGVLLLCPGGPPPHRLLQSRGPLGPLRARRFAFLASFHLTTCYNGAVRT